jgi:hypothetical protein
MKTRTKIFIFLLVLLAVFLYFQREHFTVADLYYVFFGIIVLFGFLAAFALQKRNTLQQTNE